MAKISSFVEAAIELKDVGKIVRVKKVTIKKIRRVRIAFTRPNNDFSLRLGTDQ